MLFLLFQIGNERCAIEAERVVEVTPLLAIQPLPNAPKGVAGLFNYRGRPVLAVDPSELLLGRPASERLNTRIIVIRLKETETSHPLVGLIAENATQMLRRDPADFTQTGLEAVPPAGLGPVLFDGKGAIHWLQETRLLPPPLRALLSAESPSLAS